MTTIRYHHEQGNIPAALANLPFFSRLKRSCLDELLHHASILQLHPGETVVAEGERTGALYFLLQGSLEVIGGGSTLARLTRAGELFGELSYISNDPHGATVRATRPTAVLKIENSLRRALSADTLAHFESVFYRFLTELLAKRLKRSSRRTLQRDEEPLVYEL